MRGPQTGADKGLVRVGGAAGGGVYSVVTASVIFGNETAC